MRSLLLMGVILAVVSGLTLRMQWRQRLIHTCFILLYYALILAPVMAVHVRPEVFRSAAFTVGSIAYIFATLAFFGWYWANRKRILTWIQKR